MNKGQNTTSLLTKLIAPFCLMSIIAGLFWPLFLHRKHIVPFHVLFGDPAIQGIDASSDRPDWRFFDESPVCKFYAEKTLAAEEIHNGRWPLWNPYNGLGAPLLADAQSQPAAPFFLPFLFNPSPWTYSWVLLVQLIFGAVGMILLLKKLGLNQTAVTSCSILFAFNPYALNYIAYSNVWSYVWFPWIFWAAEKGVGNKKYIPLLAGLIACMAMSGHVEVAFFGAVSVELYLIVRSITSNSLRTHLKAILVLPVLVIGLSAFWLLPFAEYVINSTSRRFGGNIPYPYHISALFVPGSEIFLSPPLLLLVIAGIASAWKKRVLPALLPLFLWALFMMFPWPLWLQKICTLDLLSGRYGRSLLWFVLLILAAHGINKISLGKLSLDIAVPAVSLMILWWITAILIKPPTPLEARAHNWVPLQGVPLHFLGPISWMTLLTLLLLIITSRSIPPGKTAILLSVIVCLSVLSYHEAFKVLWNCSSPRPAEAISAMESPGGGRSWFPSSGYWKSMPPNFSCAFRIRDVRYNDPLWPRDLKPLYAEETSHSDMFQSWNGDLMNFLGVDSAWLAHPDIVRGTPSITDHKNPDFHSRGLFIARAQKANGPMDGLAKAYYRGNWKHTVFLEHLDTSSGAIDRSSSHSGEKSRISFLDDLPGYISVEIKTSTKGWFILRDLYWPGWKASIDGTHKPVLRADGVFRAIAVPRGRHLIVFRYWPLSFQLGLIITLLSIVVATGFRFFLRDEISEVATTI